MAEEKVLTGIDEIEQGFTAEPDMNPVEKVEMDSFVVGQAEMKADLEAAGIEVPAEEKKELPVEETAIGLEEAGFAEVPELTPIEQLDVDAFIASPAEIEDDMKKAGVD